LPLTARFSGKNVVEHKMFVPIFFTYFLSETFLILRRSEQGYVHRHVLVFMKSNRYACLILMKLGFCVHFRKKYSNTRLIKIRPWEVACFKGTDIQTDRNDEVGSRCSQYSIANAPKNCLFINTRKYFVCSK
jgi:hypothetical protein